jgi:hypothetical protein
MHDTNQIVVASVEEVSDRSSIAAPSNERPSEASRGLPRTSHRRTNTMKGRRVVAVIVAVTGIALTTCQLPTDGTAYGIGLIPNQVSPTATTPTFGVPMTRDGTPYSFTPIADRQMRVLATSSTGGDTREFIYSPNQTNLVDSTVCATVRATAPFQPGLLVRINSDGPFGQLRAFGVDENVWGPAYNVFNLMTWNASLDPPFALYAHFTIPGLPVSTEHFPLNMCARTTGRLFQFIVWTAGMSQPNWGDPNWGGSVTCPTDIPATGWSGYYLGHLTAGNSATFNNLRVRPDGQPGSPF